MCFCANRINTRRGDPQRSGALVLLGSRFESSAKICCQITDNTRLGTYGRDGQYLSLNVLDFDYATKHQHACFYLESWLELKLLIATLAIPKTQNIRALYAKKAVTLLSRAISCDTCDNWTHSKCTGSISNKQYDKLVKNNSAFSYICYACTAQSLHFRNQTSISDEPEYHIPKNLKSVSEDQSKNNEFDCFTTKGLHFVGLNIGSLLPKIEQLRIFAKSNKPAVISLSETWLDNSITPNEIHIPGCSIERKDRDRQGGGVCICINDNLSYNARKDIHDENLEGIWIDV